jgi:hypothetical protein
MVDPLEFSWKVVENQGIIALVLLIMMFQNSKERSALLHKNCELSKFIMECLKLKLSEDSPLPGSDRTLSKSIQTDDIGSNGTIIDPFGKV